MQIVNVGCGMNPTDKALNIDNSISVLLGKHAVLLSFCDALHLLPQESLDYARFCKANHIARMSCTDIHLPDNSVDVLYSSHMLEHLLRVHAAAFLREAKRILKPETGILRLAVPDMRMIVEKYLADGDCDSFVEHTLLANDHSGVLKDHIRFAITGFRGHRWMYDARSLTALLAQHGFTEINVLSPGETSIQYPTGIDYFERADESIYVECRKP